MARFRPYHMIDNRSVSAEPWAWSVEGQTPQDPGRTVEGWDYAAHLRIESRVTVSEKAVRAAYVAPQDVALVVIADCPSAFLRRVARLEWGQLTHEGAWDIAVDFRPGELADFVHVQRHLVLTRDVARGRFSAHRGGSILWQDTPTRLDLEGDSSRFPTEIVSFAALGGLTGPFRDAPWFVHIDFDDPNENFRNGVRLLVNSDHSIGARIADPGTTDFAGLMNQMRVDVVHAVVAHMSNIDFPDAESAVPDSMAAVAHTMVGTYLGMTLATAVNEYREQPAVFAARLRSNMGFLEGRGRA